MLSLIRATVLTAGFVLASSLPTTSAPTSRAVHSDLAATASAAIKIKSHFGGRRRCLRWGHYYNSYRRCTRWYHCVHVRASRRVCRT